MAATSTNSLPALLANLTASLNSAAEIVPASDATAPPKDGISLLDVKNELLLSYLQNLVFLIVLKLRNAGVKAGKNEDEEEEEGVTQDVVKKLVELRVYLEKGVRPLEGRLKYQIDKVVRAADDAARIEAQKSGAAAAVKPKSSKKADASDESADDDDEEASGSDSDAASDAPIDELSYRPNPASFMRPAAATATATKDSTAPSDGIYRPPRITATAMPTITRGKEEKGAYAPAKSATMDEFISTELSAAPVAEPSIGSTIMGGGRRVKSQRERDEEAERRTYEETNFVRLPKESKKERAKKGKVDKGGYGGEEWRGLGAGLDRIERLTAKKGGSSGGGAGGALERSRKRAIEDGPRGDGSGGAQAGAMFNKKRKTMRKR